MNTQGQSIRTAKWFSNELYPFTSHNIAVDGQNMHYIDEGSGPVIVFVHGTPAWSFLYRDLIRELSKTHRCIAPDHIGFGLSSKPESFDYSPQAHAARLGKWLEMLSVEEFTLVVHDFGGPIGLSYAIQNPGKVKNIVMFNTWMWSTADNPDAVKADKILKSGLGKFLYRRMNFSPKVLLKSAFHNKKRLTKQVHRHYTGVFPSAAERSGPYGMGLGLVGASEWYGTLWDQRAAITGKPWLVLWGMKDKFIRPEFLKRWSAELKNAEIHEMEAGHFVQEEKTEEVTALMLAFLQKH